MSFQHLAVVSPYWAERLEDMGNAPDFEILDMNDDLKTITGCIVGEAWNFSSKYFVEPYEVEENIEGTEKCIECSELAVELPEHFITNFSEFKELTTQFVRHFTLKHGDRLK